jgi:acetyl esterase/lipase
MKLDLLALLYLRAVGFALVAALLIHSPLLAEPQASNASSGTTVHRDLPYVEGGHERQRLDLYLPKNAKGQLPVIVWIHGGAWFAGSKDLPGDAMAFVDKGYAVASIGYRLSQHATFPAQIEDCKAAIRFLRANAERYELDGDHFGVWGVSAGGHLAALLGTTGDVDDLEGKTGNNDQSSRVQAVVDFFGPTDFSQMSAHSEKGSLIDHDSPDAPEAKLIGGSIPENPEKTQRANPVHYITTDDPPFLIVHGDRDPIVPCHQSELLNEAIKMAGVEVMFNKIAGAGHGGPQFNSDEVVEAVDTFLAEHLREDRSSEVK